MTTKLALWNHPGDIIYALAAQCEKMVDTMEDLLRGKVYHHHSKFTPRNRTKAYLRNRDWPFSLYKISSLDAVDSSAMLRLIA